MKKIKLLGLGIFLLLVLAFTRIPPTDRYFEIIKNLDIFTALFKEVNEYYVDEINPNLLIQTGIEAMLKTLDPYTVYIPADRIERYRIQTTGEYSGIGAVIEELNGMSTIMKVYQGYAADEAGLLPGDQITKIDNKTLAHKTQEEKHILLRGQSNTEVTLTIKRLGKPSTFDTSLRREKIALNSVSYSELLTEDIGYIKLTSFTHNVGRSVGVGVLELIDKGAKKIILDLRGNPGGLLHEAVNVSNVFIEKSEKIVVQKGKIAEENITYKTLNKPINTTIPLAILIDNNSASASEIVSGVVQDYDRGILIGRKTFGKGLVQIERPLSYDAVAKITTAKYYTPSGRCIQAIDYAHKNLDGSVEKIPDSLKNEFQTRAGRKVYDGGGIDPDVVVTKNTKGRITDLLINKRYIFRYATKYYYDHEEEIPKNAKSFEMSDTEYQKFVQWIKDKPLEFKTPLEEKIKELEEIAKKEGQLEFIKTPLDLITSSIESDFQKEVLDKKKEIKELLEEEIIGHYFLDEGKTEASLDHDTDVRRAIQLLNDSIQYHNILKGTTP